MKKKNIKEAHENNGPCHVFEAGDLCRNQNGDMCVIVEVVVNYGFSSYRKMQLQDASINTLNMGTIHSKKGDISEQPCSVFDKWHYKYQPQ